VRSDEVSTGSGSDRVSVLANSTVGWIETRSLPLPVLTAKSLPSVSADLIPVSNSEPKLLPVLLAPGEN
jgi:hypothetical protein